MKIVVVSILALAVLTVSYYFLNNRAQKHAYQKSLRNSAKEAAEHPEVDMIHCLIEVEAEYVADVEREYTAAQLHGLLNHATRYDLSPDILHRIEQKKETSANNCRKDYGQTVSPAPSP